jgi:hypothetical protein
MILPLRLPSGADVEGRRRQAAGSFSTHPSDATRINQLRLVAEADLTLGKLLH